LFEVAPLADINDCERVDVWFAFKEIYSSNKPCDIQPQSMGGIMCALINRGFIKFTPDGRDLIGKKAVAVCITSAGFSILQSDKACEIKEGIS